MLVTTDARKVLDELARFGIEIQEEQAFDIEIACSFFFPNHIISVVRGCLSGGGVASKLAKAQEQGWTYFDRPTYQLLAKRKSAQRPGRFSVVELERRRSSRSIWQALQRSFLVADPASSEILVLFSLVEYSNSEIVQAIRACRERGVRTLSYLAGVLKRQRQTKKNQAAQVDDEYGNMPWEPPPDFQPLSPADRARLIVEWSERLDFINTRKGLNDA